MAKTQFNATMAIALVIIVVLAGVVFLNWQLPFIQQPAPITITPPPPTGTTPPTAGQAYSAKAQWQIRDKLTRTATAAGDTGYVSIARANSAGLFDLLNAVEETEYDAAPDTSAGTYTTGDKLILAVSSDNDPTGGDETYPRWFYVNSLDHGAKVLAFPIVNPISALNAQVDGTGQYKYTVNQAALQDVGQSVVWLAGTTPYWDFGTFELYGRVDNAGMIQQLTNKGTVGTTLNDGATWEDTVGEINANFTFTSDQEDIYFELIGEAADVAYGLPYLAVTATGQVIQYNAVLVITTNALSLSIQPLLDDGWVQLNKPDLTADLAFYYILDPTKGGIPANGDIINIKVPITINDAGLTASTTYQLEGWVLDGQNVAYVAQGTTTTSLPTVNGFLTEYGLDTVVEPLALTVSSGSAATMQLLSQFATNA